MVERDQQAFQNMGALLRLAQIEARTADDDVFLVLDVVEQHLLERKRVGHAVDQREHVHAQPTCSWVCLYNLLSTTWGMAFCFSSMMMSTGLLRSAPSCTFEDLGEFLLANELAQLGHQVGTVHLIGDLGDDDGALAVLALDNFVLGANRQAAAAGLVCVDDALAAHDDAAGGEVGARKHSS